MDAAYLSALAALAGSTIGGLTSLATSWLTQHGQFRAQQLSHKMTRREELYKEFIDEASKLYADAFENENAPPSKLVKLFSLVSTMRVVSSPQIVESADRVVRMIVKTYQARNRTIRDVPGLMDSGELDPLWEFGNACREELHAFR